MHKKLISSILLMLASLIIVECEAWSLSGVYTLNAGIATLTNQTFTSGTARVTQLAPLQVRRVDPQKIISARTDRIGTDSGKWILRDFYLAEG